MIHLTKWGWVLYKFFISLFNDSWKHSKIIILTSVLGWYGYISEILEIENKKLISPRNQLLLAILKILKHDEFQDTFTQLTDISKSHKEKQCFGPSGPPEVLNLISKTNLNCKSWRNLLNEIHKNKSFYCEKWRHSSYVCTSRNVSIKWQIALFVFA